MTSAHPQCLLGRVVGPSPDPKARAALLRRALDEGVPLIPIYDPRVSPDERRMITRIAERFIR